MEFYICEHCGNIIAMVKNKGVPVKCCGQNMTRLEAGTSDGAVEKHVPVCSIEGDIVTVRVGSVDHPMLEEHYIEWIAIKTAQGAQRKLLKPGDAPCAVFALAGGDSFVEAYAYCNLHSLWRSE